MPFVLQSKNNAGIPVETAVLSAASLPDLSIPKGFQHENMQTDKRST